MLAALELSHWSQQFSKPCSKKTVPNFWTVPNWCSVKTN